MQLNKPLNTNYYLYLSLTISTAIDASTLLVEV